MTSNLASNVVGWLFIATIAIIVVNGLWAGIFYQMWLEFREERRLKRKVPVRKSKTKDRVLSGKQSSEKEDAKNINQ